MIKRTVSPDTRTKTSQIREASRVTPGTQESLAGSEGMPGHVRAGCAAEAAGTVRRSTAGSSQKQRLRFKYEEKSIVSGLQPAHQPLGQSFRRVQNYPNGQECPPKSAGYLLPTQPSEPVCRCCTQPQGLSPGPPGP